MGKAILYGSLTIAAIFIGMDLGSIVIVKAGL